MILLPDLAEHGARHQLALFLGADLPQALTGLPSRADLARLLGERAGIATTTSLAAVAQRTMQGGNRWAFTDLLTRQLDTHGKAPQPLHQLVARLPAQTIVTTAYDDLLERAFAEAGIAINALVRDSDLAFADPRRPTLVKLYGDLRQRDTLVVTEDDHYGLWRNRDKEGLLDEVRAALRRNAVLFVGHNLADPDFMLLWREVLDRMGRFALGAYAVYPGLSADDQRVWAERQVRVIDADPLAVLGALAPADATAPAAKPSPTVAVPTATPADTAGYQRLLATHRGNLQHLLEQAAQHGGEFSAPLPVVNALAEQRRIIAQLKAALGTLGAAVADLPFELPND